VDSEDEPLDIMVKHLKKTKTVSKVRPATKVALKAVSKKRVVRPTMKKSNLKGFNSISGLPRGLVAAPSTLHIPRVFRFSTAPNLGSRDGLRMHVVAPYLNVGVNASSSVNGGILLDASGNYHTGVLFDPNVTGIWLSEGVPLMSGCFARYCVRRLKFMYRQNGGVSTERAPMYFGWVNDPNHPAGSSPTFAKLENLQAFTTFNAWENWDLEVDVDSCQLNYSTNAGSGTADARLNYPGLLLGVQGTMSTPALTYGILYVETVIDLYDFSPIYSSFSLAAKSTRVQEECKTPFLPALALAKSRAADTVSLVRCPSALCDGSLLAPCKDRCYVPVSLNP